MNHISQINRKPLYSLLFLMLLVGCSEQTKLESDTSDINQSFSEFSDAFLDEFWSYSPSWATYVGYYKYDDQLAIPDQASRNAELDFIQRSLDDLDKFDINALSQSHVTDVALIRNQLESTRWYINTFKPHEWDPSAFNVASIFGLILNTEYKTLDERLKVISRRLNNVPAYYAAAQQGLVNPTPQHTRLAIEQNTGALKVFEESIPEQILNSTLSDEDKEVLNTALTSASSAIKSYIAWLQNIETDLEVAEHKGIGEALYQQKFSYDIYSSNTARQLYEKAIAEKESLHQKMIGLTEQLWPKYLSDQPMPEQPLVAVKPNDRSPIGKTCST